MRGNFCWTFYLVVLIKGQGLIKSNSFPSGDMPKVRVEPTMSENGPLYKSNICAEDQSTTATSQILSQSYFFVQKRASLPNAKEIYSFSLKIFSYRWLVLEHTSKQMKLDPNRLCEELEKIRECHLANLQNFVDTGYGGERYRCRKRNDPIRVEL